MPTGHTVIHIACHIASGRYRCRYLIFLVCKPRDKAAMLVVSTKEFFLQNLHQNRAHFPADRNAFVFDPQQGARDVTCKPAMNMEDSLSFRLATLEDFDEVKNLSRDIYEGHDYLPGKYHHWLKQDNITIMGPCQGKIRQAT